MKLTCKRSALHARAELLIPWLVNGSLPAEAEPAVREHIAACPGCRADFEEQLRVSQAMRADGPLVFAGEPSYQKLLARIQSAASRDEPPEEELAEEVMDVPAVRAAHPFRRSPPVVRWLAAAVILQAFALGVGAWAWHSSTASRSADYATLTSSAPSYDSSPRVRVLFRPDLSVAALQGVLQAAGAHIIDGPADGNVYTLGFARGTSSRAALAQQITALRTNPAILFAEPVQEGVR
ncbi:MAG TPA: zf-HC2 domain-containing protein [Steroidobacteraceae bacterium]